MKAFLGELKRRRVPRVVLVYAAGAAALIQAADVIVPRLGLPSSIVTVLVWCAVIGLPVAAVLSWIFELSGSGIQRETDVAAATARGPAWISPRTAVVVAVLLAATAGTGWWAGQTIRPIAVEDATRSIAVLPFAAAEGEDASFAEGLADELLTVLGRINGLKVAARTSSFAFRDAADVRVIGDSLGVSTVLEGAVRRDDGRVRVSATLIDVTSGLGIWSEQYEEDVAQAFLVQEQLARAIARQLELRLGDGAAIAARRATPPQALEAYLRGLAHFRDRNNVEDMHAAIANFQSALAEAPDFAEAWGGLAMAYAVLPGFDTVSVTTTAPRVREYAERASRLDDRLATPHAALCESLGMQEWRWAEAEQACRAAIERNGSFETAHAWLGALLAIQGRYEESDVAFSRALLLDPRSPVIQRMAAAAALSARDLARAERYVAESHRLDPAELSTQYLLSGVRVLRKDFTGARDAFVTATPAEQQQTDVFLRAVSDPAVRAAVLPIFHTTIDSTVTNWATFVSISLSMLSDTAGALRYMQVARDRREYILAAYIHSPFLDMIRTRPEYQDVLRSMHLER